MWLRKNKIITGLIIILGISLAATVFLFCRKQGKKELDEIPVSNFVKTFDIPEVTFADRMCNIVDYGAKNDGQSINTLAFKSAIEACAEQGGGTVLVTAGQWLTGPINLKDNINLHLEKDAEILFSTNFSDYLPAVFSRYEGIECFNFSPPIYTKDAKNVAITGEGKINGQAEKSWWDSQRFPADKKNIRIYRLGQRQAPVTERVFGQVEDGFRPAFVEFVNCDHVLIDGATFVNGPMWTIHPLYSKDVVIRNVKIRTERGNSTDGIVIDSSKNVLIENSDFSTGDDAIALKSGRDTDGNRVNRPTENVIIRNCHANAARAAIAIGSEVSGGIKNVLVDNYSADEVMWGIRIKSGIERGGYIDDIQVQNMKIENAEEKVIEIDQTYKESIKLDSHPDINPSRMQNIRLINITAEKSEEPLVISGYESLPVTDISFTNLNISSKRRVQISNAENIQFDNFALKSKEMNPMIDIKDSQNITFKNSKFSRRQIDCEKCRFN